MKKAKSLRVGNGAHKDTDVGPLISPEAKERAVRLITGGIHQARPLRSALELAALGAKRVMAAQPGPVSHVKPLSCMQVWWLVACLGACCGRLMLTDRHKQFP